MGGEKVCVLKMQVLNWSLRQDGGLALPPPGEMSEKSMQSDAIQRATPPCAWSELCVVRTVLGTVRGRNGRKIPQSKAGKSIKLEPTNAQRPHT